MKSRSDNLKCEYNHVIFYLRFTCKISWNWSNQVVLRFGSRHDNAIETKRYNSLFMDVGAANLCCQYIFYNNS